MSERRDDRTDRELQKKVLTFASSRDLSGRREIAIELPEFLIVLLEERVGEANLDAGPDERITVSHLVEYQIAEMLSIKDVAELDLQVPGFSAAVERWLVSARE